MPCSRPWTPSTPDMPPCVVLRPQEPGSEESVGSWAGPTAENTGAASGSGRRWAAACLGCRASPNTSATDTGEEDPAAWPGAFLLRSGDGGWWSRDP